MIKKDLKDHTELNEYRKNLSELQATDLRWFTNLHLRSYTPEQQKLVVLINEIEKKNKENIEKIEEEIKSQQDKLEKTRKEIISLEEEHSKLKNSLNDTFGKGLSSACKIIGNLVIDLNIIKTIACKSAQSLLPSERLSKEVSENRKWTYNNPGKAVIGGVSSCLAITATAPFALGGLASLTCSGVALTPLLSSSTCPTIAGASLSIIKGATISSTLAAIAAVGPKAASYAKGKCKIKVD